MGLNTNVNIGKIDFFEGKENPSLMDILSLSHTSLVNDYLNFMNDKLEFIKMYSAEIYNQATNKPYTKTFSISSGDFMPEGYKITCPEGFYISHIGNNSYDTSIAISSYIKNTMMSVNNADIEPEKTCDLSSFNIPMDYYLNDAGIDEYEIVVVYKPL